VPVHHDGGQGRAQTNEKSDSNWCDFPGNSEGYADGDWETGGPGSRPGSGDYFLSRLYYVQNDPAERCQEDLPTTRSLRTRGLQTTKERVHNDTIILQFKISRPHRPPMVGRSVLTSAT